MINKGLFRIKEDTKDTKAQVKVDAFGADMKKDTKAQEGIDELDAFMSLANICSYCGETVGARAVYSGKHHAFFCDEDCMKRMDE